MSSVRFIEDKGKRILFMDAVNCDMGDLMVLIVQAKALISKESFDSLYTLTVLNKGSYHGGFRKVAKEYTAFNKPYVKAGAIVGLDAAAVKEFEEVMKYSQREFKFFPDVPTALQWIMSL